MTAPRGQRRTRLLAQFAVGVAAATVLAACSSSGNGGSSGAEQPPSTPNASGQESAPPSGSSSGGSSSGGTVKIGFFAPESGSEAADGKSALDAAQLAVKDLNAAGGIGGAQIKLVQYDDGSDPKQAVTIATKLTTQDKVAAVISGSYSDQTLAAASIFQRAGVPMLASYAVNPGIPSTGNQIFQLDFNGEVEGRGGAVALADKLGAKKIAIVSIDNDFGSALVKGFKEQAAKLGATIVATDKNQFGEKDFGPIIDRDVSAGADGFYLVEYAPEAQQFIAAYNQRKLTQKIVGTEGIDSTLQFIQPTGKDAEGVVFTSSLNRDSTDPTTQAFFKNFNAAYGHAPDMVAATVYDAFGILKEGAANGTSSADIQKGVAALKGYTGVCGEISSFKNNSAVRAIDLEIFKNGEVHHFGTIDDPSIITP